MTATTDEGRPVLIRLRRDGEWPLRFLGQLIARHDGAFRAEIFHGQKLWHDLALYRDIEGRYVVEIVARGAIGAVRCHAALADTLDAALTVLETHPAADDLCPGLTTAAVGFDDPTVSPASLVAQMAALRHARHDVERRYRIGVGTFLMALGEQDV